jgi:hypothetical protein
MAEDADRGIPLTSAKGPGKRCIINSARRVRGEASAAFVLTYI